MLLNANRFSLTGAVTLKVVHIDAVARHPGEQAEAGATQRGIAFTALALPEKFLPSLKVWRIFHPVALVNRMFLRRISGTPI